MECDVILEIGGKNNFKIDRESSEKELDSLQDIVEYLDTLPEHKIKQLIYDLQTSSTRVKNSQKYFLDKQLIGNCSFENLKLRYPEETELIKDIDKNRISEIVCKNIVNFARDLNMKTIAEFVENESIFNKVKELGIDYSQGYYFDKPLEIKS